MVICHFSRLRREKALRENRDISLRKLAIECGLSMPTIQRLGRNDVDGVYLSTLNILCNYFDLKEMGQLLEFVPDEYEVKP